MKVAVSSTGENLDAQLDPRFGRCHFFLVVNPDDLSFEAFNNESAAQGGGAGIQTAQFLASQGVEAVITGNCGPNAVQTLSAAGIELFGGQAGTVRDVIERFKHGKLKQTGETTVESHFGINATAGFGRGGGRCGGMATGRGLVGGRGMDRDTEISHPTGSRKKEGDAQSSNQELEVLKQKANSLNRKMKELISHINRLENQ